MKLTRYAVAEASERFMLALYEHVADLVMENGHSFTSWSLDGKDLEIVLEKAGIQDATMIDRVQDEVNAAGFLKGRDTLTHKGLVYAESLWEESQRYRIAKLWDRVGAFANGVIVGAIGQAIIQALCQSQAPWWAWWL